MDDEFEQWWSIFPKHVAKADARKAWKQTAAIRPALDELVKAVKNHAQSDQWQRGFIPLGATWLRGERWDDVYEIKLPQLERKPDRYELANIEMARKDAEWKARQALVKAAA